jgi:hypothetical protein
VRSGLRGRSDQGALDGGAHEPVVPGTGLRASRRCTIRAHRPPGGRGWSATGPRTLVTPWTAPDLAGLAYNRLDHDSHVDKSNRLIHGTRLLIMVLG